MKELAPGVWQHGFRNLINVYFSDGILFDAATRHDGKRILKALSGHTVTAHAITHAHPDHQGATHQICTELGIPCWAPEGDADAIEDPSLISKRQPSHPLARLFDKVMTGPAHPVDRRLKDGDDVNGFRVIDAPGHSAGHVVYFRESDRVLILGDVLNNMDIITTIPGLTLPKNFVTPDPERNRQSARALADLEPSLVLFGHGAPLRDTAKFVSFCRSL
jgi:glyoxylase-like metal-dependent hydrolase (beta-lactamase superfamily II)